MRTIDHLDAAVRHLHEAREQGVGDADLARVVVATQSVIRAAQALLLDATAAADAANTARGQGASSTAAWVAQTSGLSRRDAAREVKLAQDLQTAPATREALSLPGMSSEKARVITRAMGDLPRGLDDHGRALVEKDLVDKAQQHSLEDLRRAARRAVEVLDREWADRIESETLAGEEKRAHRQAEFWMRPADDDGMVEGGFTLPQLEADILRSALESHTAPRHDCVRQPDDTELLEQSPTYPQKLGRAFGDILRHLPTDCYGNHGGVAATLMVTIDYESLRGVVDRAGADSHGTRVDPATVRRLACDAGILPAVLSGNGKVLDVGRQKRLFTTAQRTALAHRDGGCAFPGCDRPPGWTEAHHMNPWATGGSTDLDDGVLLCAHHHRTIHHSEWEVRPGPDRAPEFIPPAKVDRHRQPRTNDRWRPARSPIVRAPVGSDHE
ncbi:DUF222 domain-containing protein [Aeromicrobium sp.]|uniref:HNH endonuclease signature motif containing protein n=1 Tax=Aeromicrobium sp. TaxID=1871063 RepID=UPI003D6AC4FA